MSYKQLPLLDKLSIIKDAEAYGQNFAASEWDINRNAVQYLLKHKEEYRKARHDAVAEDLERSLKREGEVLHPRENQLLERKICLGIFFMFNFILM